MHRVHADRLYAPVPLPRRRAKSRAPVRDFRARGKLKLVALHVAIAESLRVVDIDRCGLCESGIDRFDRPTFEIHGHCCGCHATLAD